MMDWTALLAHYGYFAVLIGTFFEGETVLLLGAYAVQQHLLNFWGLIAVAMLGGFAGDQLYYQIGKKYGDPFIQSRPKLAAKFDQASQLIERYPKLTILFMRFAWGLRTVIPMSFGVKKYSMLHYILMNIVACFIWAFVMVSVGLQLSHWLHQLWKALLPQHHVIIVSSILVIGIAITKIALHISSTKSK